jgi:hypothetical protein
VLDDIVGERGDPPGAAGDKPGAAAVAGDAGAGHQRASDGKQCAAADTTGALERGDARKRHGVAVIITVGTGDPGKRHVAHGTEVGVDTEPVALDGALCLARLATDRIDKIERRLAGAAQQGAEPAHRDGARGPHVKGARARRAVREAGDAARLEKRGRHARASRRSGRGRPGLAAGRHRGAKVRARHAVERRLGHRLRGGPGRRNVGLQGIEHGGLEREVLRTLSGRVPHARDTAGRRVLKVNRVAQHASRGDRTRGGRLVLVGGLAGADRHRAQRQRKQMRGARRRVGPVVFFFFFFFFLSASKESGRNHEQKPGKKKKKKTLVLLIHSNCQPQKSNKPPTQLRTHASNRKKFKTKLRTKAEQDKHREKGGSGPHAPCRAVAADRLEDPDVRRRVDRRKGPARRARAVERARRDGARETHRKAGARDVPHGRAVRRGADNAEDEEEGDRKNHILYNYFFLAGNFCLGNQNQGLKI